MPYDTGSSVNVVTELRAEQFETGIMTGGTDFYILPKVQMELGGQSGLSCNR